MGLTDIKKELKKLDKDKLVDIVADLYKKNKTVKDYFDFFVNPNEKLLLNKYRDKIFEAFYPKRGFNYKLKDAKQAITDFKKYEPATELLADLMLFYVECGVKFTNDFGDINEQFYVSLEREYEKTLTLIQKEDLLDKFGDRAKKIIDDTSDIGWGFHDYLASVYFDFYANDIEEIDEGFEKNN